MVLDVEEYRKKILNCILNEIKERPEVLAAWEGGSTANGTKDQFSDIDLCILAKAPIQLIIETVENSLQKFQVSHTWQTSKSFWGEGIVQRVIVLKDSPKFFSVDVAVFDQAYPQLLKDFLEVERHGSANILLDKFDMIKVGHTDASALFERQKIRVSELSQGFPIFKNLVLKEIERGNAIDALGFYQNGLVRPLIEVLGMIHRPFQYDFGMRYIRRSFPVEDQMLIEDLNYVSDFKELPLRINKTERAFMKAVERVKNKTALVEK